MEGQWVFSGIEQDSRKCFLVAVEKRDEATQLSIIQKWITPGKIITVNHSIEFVNKEGTNTNKMERHWSQAKCRFPKFGVRKHLFSTYLAEFIWRYMHSNEDFIEIF